MNHRSQSDALIKACIEEALRKYTTQGNAAVITDIHMQPKMESGELLILNDDDEILSKTLVEEWTHLIAEEFFTKVEIALRGVLTDLQQSKKLDNLSLLKPYSFVLIDEDKETVAELLLVDDLETLLLSDELLKGLDEELDAFLKDLLEK